MSEWQTLEARIKGEYPVIKAWIATHVYTSVFLAFAVGAVIGHVV